jgi:hypothetical protein
MSNYDFLQLTLIYNARERLMMTQHKLSSNRLGAINDTDATALRMAIPTKKIWRQTRLANQKEFGEGIMLSV